MYNSAGLHVLQAQKVYNDGNVIDNCLISELLSKIKTGLLYDLKKWCSDQMATVFVH